MVKRNGMKRFMVVAAAVLVGVAGVGTGPAQAVTKRQAYVQVVNNTATKFDSVTIYHKYSNVYKNDKTWWGLAPWSSTDNSMTVQYHTGFGTTGRDWWYLMAVDDKGVTYISYPRNFRWFVDWLEGAVLDWAEGVKDTYDLGYVQNYQQMRNEAIKQLLAATARILLDNEKTDGFKQHILRSEDENKTVKFTITGLPTQSEKVKDDALKISSESGVSWTNIGFLKNKK